MTNQEAIEHIKNIKIYSYQDGYTDEAREALDMAIKALEAQELSNNSPKLDSEFGDLISRQDAIDALKQLQKNISGDYTELDPMVMAGTAYIGDCIGELQDMPSAQPDIIHCGECKYYHDSDGCFFSTATTRADGFCHWAE